MNQPQQPAPQPPQPPQPAAVPAQPQVTPLAAFAPQPAPQAAETPPGIPRPQLVDTTQMAPAVDAPVQAPNRKVLFDVEGFGNHEAYYHDVIVQGELALILVYDKRHVGSKYFPKMPAPGQQQLRQAAQIDDRPTFYLVQPTGVQYTHGNYEYCVLLITQVTSPEPSNGQTSGYQPGAHPGHGALPGLPGEAGI